MPVHGASTVGGMLFGRRIREVGGEESVIKVHLWTRRVFDDDDDERNR